MQPYGLLLLLRESWDKLSGIAYRHLKWPKCELERRKYSKKTGRIQNLDLVSASVMFHTIPIAPNVAPIQSTLQYFYVSFNFKIEHSISHTHVVLVHYCLSKNKHENDLNSQKLCQFSQYVEFPTRIIKSRRRTLCGKYVFFSCLFLLTPNISLDFAQSEYGRKTADSQLAALLSRICSTDLI